MPESNAGLLSSEGLSLRPDMDSMPRAISYVEGVLEAAGVPMRTAAKLNIAVDEIYANIIMYSGASQAHILCRAEDGQVTLSFSDDGIPYDPLDAPEPDTALAAEEREIGGLGIFMVRKSMDQISYSRLEGRNVLTLTK